MTAIGESRAGARPMHTHSLEQWTHDHVFLGQSHEHNERRTWFVVALTVIMMVGEIVAGSYFGSMALFADGWHMGTHAAALGIAGAAYLFARQQANNARFAFGTGKFGDLAAFSSAIILGVIALQIAYESLLRLMAPVPIAYGEAIAVACLGLCVNALSAFLLRDSHDDHHHNHHHHHHHHHHHPHHHHGLAHDDGEDDDDHHHEHHDHDHGHVRDNNFRAAYVHVLADAATSVLAIAALVIAKYSGWVWTDPAVGIAGSCVIGSWAYQLIRDAGSVLLDVSADKNLDGAIRTRLETRGDRVTDMHLWQLGPGHRAAVISLVSDDPLPPSDYKSRLTGLKGLSHVTIEVETCRHAQAQAC
jgi:cation diffusion facilitator family transporter